jgi:hypothetical protein
MGEMTDSVVLGEVRRRGARWCGESRGGEPPFIGTGGGGEVREGEVMVDGVKHR